MSTTWINRGHLYAPHVTPVIVDCAFQVQVADTGGLGISTAVASPLTGQGVANVFMHTTATPGRGSNGQLNPNPASGYIYIQMSDNFYKTYMIDKHLRGPLSGSNLAVNATALTVGNAYVITVLGTTTAADWLALGVPAGVTPAVNVAFIAKVTGTGAGSGQVQTQSATGIFTIEGTGSPSLALAPIPTGPSPNVGGWILLECRNAAGALTAPATGSTIHLSFYMSQSSVVVKGE